MKLNTLLVSAAILAALTGTAAANGTNGTNSTAAAQPKQTVAHCRIFADVNRSFITHLIPFVPTKIQKNVEFTMMIDKTKSFTENLYKNQNIVDAAELQLVKELYNDNDNVKSFGITCDNFHS